MSNSSPPPYSSLAIQITCAVQAFSVVVVAQLGLRGYSSALEFLVPVLFTIALVGMCIAARRLPWWQAAAGVGCVFLLHSFAEHFLPLVFVSDFLIEYVCVRGFGWHWVKKAYIPPDANVWP